MAISAQIARVSPWHQRFAMWLLVHGETKGWGKAAAAEFNVTQAWLSTVYHSDAFQEYYKQLREKHEGALLQSVSEKLVGALGQSLDILQEKLETEGKALPYETILETVDVLAKRGTPAQRPGEQQQVAVALVTQEELAAFRDRMRQRRQASEAIELKAEDITPPAASGSSAPEAK